MCRNPRLKPWAIFDRRSAAALTELRVEQFVEPAGAAPGDGHCPMDDGVALIMFAGQTRKIKAAVCSLAGKTDGITGWRLGLHWGRIEPTHVGCHDYFVASNVGSIIRKQGNLV